MLPTSARSALLSPPCPFVGRGPAPRRPRRPGVVVAPLAPPPSTSTPTVDPSTAPASSDASVTVGDGASPRASPATRPRPRGCEPATPTPTASPVPRVGCCHNGWNEAVAVSQRDAYAASFVCPEAHPVCAMFLVRDTRVPQCDAGTTSARSWPSTERTEPHAARSSSRIICSPLSSSAAGAAEVLHQPDVLVVRDDPRREEADLAQVGHEAR